MFGVQLSRALIEEDFINLNMTKRKNPAQQQKQLIAQHLSLFVDIFLIIMTVMPCIYFLYSDMQLGNNSELNLYLHTVHLKNKSGTPCLESTEYCEMHLQVHSAL